MNAARTDVMLRVDQAGEYGAKRIYAGQLAVLGDRHPSSAEIRHMAAQEDVHLDKFNALLAERGVRPTVLQPFWHVAGFALGAATALIGPKAAMACTAAIETEIDRRYSAQLDALGDAEPALHRSFGISAMMNGRTAIRRWRRVQNRRRLIRCSLLPSVSAVGPPFACLKSSDRRARLAKAQKEAEDSVHATHSGQSGSPAIYLPVMPAQAQRTERVLIIFGNDPCPTNASGDEIIVCARRPESERYRIPQELRPRGQSPDSKSWAVRAQSTLDTGRTGIGSCSATGAGGWTGCWAEQMRQAKEEARQKAEADRDLP